MPSREGKQSQNNGPTLLVHDCLVQNGQRQVSMVVGLLAFLSRQFSLHKALPGFFPLYFHLSLPALGTDLKSRKGPYSDASPIQNAPMQRQIQYGESVLYCGPSLFLSRIVRNSTELYLRCEESSRASGGDERHQFFPLVVVLSMLQEVWEDVKLAKRVLNADNTKVMLHYFFSFLPSCPNKLYLVCP